MGGSAPEEGPHAGPVEPRDCGHGRQRRLGACTACRAEAAGVVVEQQGQKLGLTTQQALSARLRLTRVAHAALDDEDARYRREEIESKGFRRDLVKATSVAEAAVLLEGHRQSQHNKKRVGKETKADTSSSTQSINEAAYKETEILDDTSFQDLSGFRTWLHESGIDTLHWGLARTKSSASLFREIQNKTSVLVIEAADGDSVRIFRLLRVVRARIKQEIERGRFRYLVEASQELGETGQLRYRNMLLSSMMRYGENAFNAARRSVEKEMQNINTVRGRCIPRRAITAKRDSPRVCVEDLESPSYPGLLTRYILVTVDVALDRRLPDADFCTVEYLPTMHIATKHYWKWRTRAEVAQIVNGKTSRSAPSTAHRRKFLLGDATESTSTLLPEIEKPFFWSLYDDDFEKASDSDDLYIPCSRLRRHMRQWGLTEDEITDLLQQIKDVLRDGSLLSKSDFKKKLADPITELIVADQDSLSSRGLSNEHYQVLNNLFPNASRIFSRILHGGFSGSFVLQAQARYCDGSQGDPTVVKLDRRDLMRDEIQRFRALAPYMGDCAPAILQTDVEGSDSLLGGIKFELVGAVWMLPDFRSNLLNSGAAQPLSTFKKLFMHESAEEERARVEHALGKTRVSSSQVLASYTSDKVLTMQTETQVARSPSSPASIASPMTGPMSPTSEDEELRSALDARSPKGVRKGTNLVYGEVYQVLKEVFGEILRTTTLSSKETISCSLLDVYKIDKYIGRLLEPPAVPGLTGAGAAGLPDWAQLDPTGSGRALLQRLLDKIDRQTYPYEMGLVHGDLNGMNILIDSHNIVWVIDFAFSGRGHVLTDIAKLESCVLFEYTQPRSNAEYEALQQVADILIQVGDLREVVYNSRFDMQTDAAPTDQLARVAFAWKAIKRLRMYAANYCETDPGPAQMLVAMLHNAARALRFTDIEDKRLPYFVATRCAQRLLNLMETNGGSIKIPARAHSEATSRHMPMNASLSADQIKYEKHRYFHDVRVRESYILDLFTREPVNILEQTVELQMIEGSSREKVMREVANMDEIQAQRRLKKRLDALRGDILGCTADKGLGGLWPASVVDDEDNGHARFTSALQVLGNPRDEGHRVLLGGAASGKSCLMRKILVSMGHDLASDGHDVIPILILIIELGRLMTERKLTSEDDLLDAYFVSTFGEGSARLAFFRQMRKEDALCYLFDGLDEAGDHKPAIERYLAGLVGHEKRIIISSRETGFNETAFRSFQFLQVMPLTDQMQSQIVEMRLGSDHPRLLTIRNELRKPQYAEIARNPLMLSLLVSLLANKASSAPQCANGERPRSNQGILTRSYLYERAVAQLLHHGSMAKFGMRRGADDKHVQRSIETLASKISYGFLKSLAFTAQSLRTRDFGPDVLNRVAETYVADPVYFSSEVMAKPLALQEEVFRVIEVLQGAVYSGLCGLFATSRVSVQPNAAAEGYGSTTSQTSPQQVLRFVHLSFQEYLAGLFIVDHLQQALRSTKDGGENPFCETIKSLLCICPEQDKWGHLHDPWWQVTLTSMAGSMPPRAFLAFAECILSWDDSSGSNVLLCAELHAEAAASESIEGARNVAAEAPRSQVETLIKSRFSDYINEEELVDALTHPSRNLQLMALAEVHKLYDSRKAAYSIMFGPGIDETTDRAPLLLLPWYRRASAAYALSHLASAKNNEVIIDVLLGLWSDESGQVRRAAVEAIAALQAESHKLVIDELHRQLHDEVESENGHELVAALRVQHPRIIEDLLTIASLDESGASSSISSNSHEALLSLPLTVELLYTLCRAVSHAKILSIRSCAARILISRCAPEAGDEAAPLNETLETAFISWLEHPEVTFCMSAAQMLAQSTFKSFRIAQALTTLQKRVASLPGDHSDLWDAALVALVAVAQPGDDLVHDALLFGLHAKASTTRGECIQLLQQLLPRILTQSQDFDESQEKRSLATSEPIEELSSAHASQEDRQATTSRVPRKNASGGPSRVKQMVRLARYAETLRDMAQEDPDANVARQAYEVGQIIPQFGSEIAHSLFADERASPKVRSAALKSILQRVPNQATIAQMLPILSEWIVNGPRGLVDAAMRAMVSLKEGGPLHSALAKGTMLSWQQACNLVETLEQNAHSVKRLLNPYQIDIVLESLFKAYTAQTQEQTAPQDMDDIAKFAFCDALSGLGDSGFAFSASESWLDRFTDSDVNLQVALATMLSDACVCSLEESIMGYVRSAETDKRVRASLALALYRLNRWKSESVQSAMEAWLSEEDESMQLAAIDVLCEIGEIGSRLVRLLPSLLHGASFRIGPAVQKARSQRAGLLTRKDTKARMRMAVLSHLRMHSDTNSLVDTVQGKVALRESIAHGVQTLMLHPKFELAETEVLCWLDDAENVKVVTCEMLAKTTCTEAARTESVAEKLFKILSALPDGPNIESKTRDTAQTDVSRVLCNAAKVALVTRFRRFLPWTAASEQRLATGSAQVREALLKTLALRDWVQDPALFNAMFPILRSSCLNDDEREVRISAVALCTDWLRAVKDTRMEPALAEAQADNVARMEGCIEGVLLSFDREPLELSAVVDLMRGSTMSKAIFMAMIKLLRECPDQNVSARCRLALSQVKSPPPFQASDLLKLDTSSHESKLLWLTLLRKLRRDPAPTEKISDAEVVIYLRKFVAPETAREYSPSTALLVIDLLRCCADLRITLESVDILNFLEVAATAYAEASDERVLRVLLQYLLVSENVRLDAAIVGHIIDLAGSESTDVTLETDRSRNIIHFFAQYQIKDAAETSSLLKVMEEHEVAASFLFEPVLSFLRRERSHRPSDEVHKSQAALRAQIDQLARAKRTLEATYLSKEIRFGFEMHDTLGVTSKQLALKGREKIKEQRVQRQALKDMREAEWEQARAEWFPPTSVDQHLEFINVPASLEYQQSRLSTASTGVFLNAIPDEMATERQILAQNVLSEIRRRLRAMGVPVALHLSNPEALGMFLEPISSLNSPSTSNFSSASGANSAAANQARIVQRTNLARECAPFMVCFLGARYGQPQHKAQIDDSIEMLERAACFLGRPNMPTSALCYFRDATFYQDLAAHLEMESIFQQATPRRNAKGDGEEKGDASSKYNAIELSFRDSEKPALANLEKVYAGEDSTDIRLKSRQEREKQAILSHPYAKSTNVRLAAPVKLQNSGHVSPNCLLDFFAQVTEDLLGRILGEFPVRTSHRAKHTAGTVCGSEELAEELPFRLTEEQRAHEHYLWEHSQLLRSDTEFGGFLPRTRQHIYQDLQHLLTEDGSSDNKLRAERRTVKNPKFWTKDEHLGNSAILLTAERYQGKTTVLATFTDWYRSTCAPSLPPIIFHSCRASAMSGDLTLLLLRLGIELLNVFHPRLDLEDWSPPCGCALNLESVRTWWHGLLCEVSSLALSDHRRPVLVIDGLFEVMDAASAESKEIWRGLLPQRYGGCCPPGISIILSASVCSNAKALARTNKRQHFPFREVQVGSLSKDEQTVLLIEALARYRMRPTESLLLRTSRASANFAPANLDIFARHVAGLHEGCTQIETRIEHLLGLLGNDELENDQEEGGGNAPDGDAVAADRDRAHTILDSILIRLEVEFGVSLCRSILTCLALTGHMDESDLFEFSSQFAETISPKEWRRLCLQLDEVVICVSVCAQNEIAPWQRRGSSLRSVNSQSSRSSRGPEARRISDLASQDLSARRRSADGGAGRRYIRHVSAPEELMRALHAETHSVRVLSLRSEWFKRGVLLRYYNTSETAKCPQLAEFYERLCRFWTSKLDVWYATSAHIPLLTHRAAVMRKVVHYALCASDPLSCIRRTLLSPKTLAAMAAQSTWYDAMSAMAEDFARALDFLQQGQDSRFTEEDAKECATKLAFARERITANVDEISANPDCVTELL